MNKLKITDENGVSLVELLAALALVSLVVILINTVFFFTRENADSISDENDVQQEMLLTMKLITQDIRAADSVNAQNHELLLNGNEKYKFIDGKLLKNDRVVAENLKNFEVCHPKENVIFSQEELRCEESLGNTNIDLSRIILILEGPENRSGKSRILATEITKRQGATP